MAGARVLVVGAGALGNEVLKLLALTGIGWTLVYDPDHIEESNLSRTVLFRASDEGKPKAQVAVERMGELGDGKAFAHAANVITRAGLGVFSWADVVIGAVDNREARVFVNAACAKTGRVWIDGAIDGLSGVVRGFDPSRGVCYECTMNATDRKLLAERRSCAMLARDIVARGHVPTTAVAASVVAALQVQEAVKLIHGQPVLLGEGLHIHGLYSQIDRTRYMRREDCMGHETLGKVEPLGVGADGITLAELLDRAEARLGAGATLELSRDVIVGLTCPTCQVTTSVGVALGGIREAEARCPTCRAHRVVAMTSSVSRDGDLDLARTPAAIGVPPFDVLVARRGLEAEEAWLLDGDAASVLGPLAPSLAESQAGLGRSLA